MTHVAVVPVADLDASTRRALRYAGTLTRRVLALHVAPDASSRGLVDAWAEDVPLVVVDGASLGHAIQVLKATEHAARVTVVLPSASAGSDLPRVLGPGVVLSRVPATVTGL